MNIFSPISNSVLSNPRISSKVKRSSPNPMTIIPSLPLTVFDLALLEKDKN